MYWDVQEAYKGGARHLEQQLRQSAAAASAAASNSQSTRSVTAQSSGSGNSTESASDSVLGPESSNASKPSRLSATQIRDQRLASAETTIESRFLLLCVNGPRLPDLQQIPVHPNWDDQVLFQDIRNAYIESRKGQERQFHEDTPIFVIKIILWLDLCWYHLQSKASSLFGRLRLGWLIWWLGNEVLFIPKKATFVRVRIWFLVHPQQRVAHTDCLKN